MSSMEFNLSKVFLQACQKGDLKIIKDLKYKYTIENWTIYRHETSGDTGLHVAAREGHLDVVKYLCEGWDLPPYKADVTNKDTKRPLHDAAQFAHIDVLKYLIQHGVEIDSLKRADWTPLMLACTKSGLNSVRCIESLLDAGADPYSRNKDGWNPLFIACRTGDVNIVNLVLNRAPKCISNRSNNGRSALHIAAFHGAVDAVERLISEDPHILNSRDTSGSTALHESTKSGVLKVTERLTNLGADTKAVDNVGQTILHVASACESVDIIEYILINKFIDIHCITQFGVTPLMVAKRYNKHLAVDVLRKFGGNK